VPDRLAKVGDPNTEMDQHAGVLDALLETAARDEAEGVGDAPWPPHFAKQEGEAKRVATSRAKQFSDQLQEGFGEHRFRRQSKKKAAASTEAAAGEAATKPKRAGRVSKMPLIIVAQSTDKAAVEAGLERWKEHHPKAAKLLAPDDVLVDRMRGSAYVWYRIRVNMRNVPEELRPAQGVPDPDDDPTRGWKEARGSEPAL
jgi:hypothetical protein